MSRLISLIAEKCPKCEQGEVFNSKGNVFLMKLPKMNKKCSNCDHTFEIEPGYFYGAMFVSYGLVILEMFFFFLASMFFDFSINTRIAIVTIPIIPLSIVNFRYSRIIWMYMFTNKIK